MVDISGLEDRECHVQCRCQRVTEHIYSVTRYEYHFPLQEEYKRVILCVEDAILATDLAVYFKRRQVTLDLVYSNAIDFSNTDHR